MHRQYYKSYGEVALFQWQHPHHLWLHTIPAPKAVEPVPVERVVAPIAQGKLRFSFFVEAPVRPGAQSEF